MQNGRVVVVTGAGGGIGTQIVDRFLANHDTVIGLDRSAKALKSLQSERPGSRLHIAEANIVDQGDLKKFHDAVKDQHGRVDVLVNCAGYYPIVPFESMKLAEWQEIIDINLTGTFQVAHTLLPLMKQTGWARIINITSASIFEGVVGQTHYVAAKAGIVGFTRSLAMELGQYGITVNCVAPGLTLTQPVMSKIPAESLRAQREARALRRDEQPRDLAGPVFLLASPDADFISGQMLVVDGGKTKH